jgi:hypothetical protein
MLLNERAGQPVRFILLGDFKGQLLAIQNSWRGHKVDNHFFRDSALLKQLAGNNRITLTECRRSDEKLFGFYASLIEGGERQHSTTEQAVADAMRAFPPKMREAEWNLSLSHAKRRRICKVINDKAAKGKPHVLVEAALSDPNSQDMLIFEGLVLVGCNQKKKGVVNGCFYKVITFNEDETTLLNLDASEAQVTEPTESETDETDENENDTMSEPISDITEATEVTVTVSTKDLSACLRLAQCLTYSACQSRTLPGRLRLHEVSHIHFTKRHLNVGLSRGTSCDLIDLRK